jgi:hypothetical protein
MNDEPTSIDDNFLPSPGILRRAVNCGLTKVDPSAYYGWEGNCPGCDVDASTMSLLCREQGYQIAEMYNADCAKAQLTAKVRKAWKDMKAGDLFVFFISSHGGQNPDMNGDEIDGMDETICLWDGQLSDDYLYELWKEAPAGLRILFITDTCNSGTNFKYKPRSLKKTIPREYSGQMIHFGGCADGESSFGDASGGAFTTALIDAWNPNLSNKEWFDAAAAKTPKNQIPYYTEYGTVTDEFRNGKALQ